MSEPRDLLPYLLPETRPYADFARELEESCLVNDPYYDGRPIFYSAPLVVPDAFYERIHHAGERIGALYHELCQIVWREPALLDSFFHLPPFYKLMWLASDGDWHGFARMDMFYCDDDTLKVCELNADTPSGQVETLVPYPFIAPHHQGLRPLNGDLEERLWRVLLQYHQRRTGDDSEPGSIGILYPTDLPEDITLIRLYQRFFEERGVHVVLGSPLNLSRGEDGGVRVLGEPVELILRHYKTDWWGERPRIFADEDDVPDPEPLSQELGLLLDAERKGKVSVVNPFGALIAQDKLAMAFFHEEKARFSEASQRTISELIPETRRLDTLDRAQLKSERERWVLKSDFGCEGDEVLVGPNVDDEQWALALDAALPHVWCVQRFFRVKPLVCPLGKSWLPNYGVFLLGGRTGGLMVRLAEEGITTGYDARVVTPFLPELG